MRFSTAQGPDASAHPVTRRRVLQLAGVAGGAVLADAVGLRPFLGRAGAATNAKWSDPATWGGQVPGPGDVATISTAVTLDVDTQVAGVVVDSGGELIFDPAASVKLSSTGNVTVRGTLTMRPASAAVFHRLVFLGVDESAFVGGGMDPLATDVGLWVVDDGRLDVVGTSKTPWARVSGSAAAGATTLRLDRVPSGWAVGDRLAVTPTSAPTAPISGSTSPTEFSEVTISGLSGSVVSLSAPLAYDHLQVKGTWSAEVLNLTRNVCIKGTSTGRTHVFVRSTSSQTLSYAAVRWAGPRKDGEKVVGRWPLHFHHCYDATRGNVLDGVVVTDAGSHAFVTHQSHGITLLNCIAYKVEEHAFWWDEGETTDDSVWDSCVAARVATTDFSVGGFYLPMGVRNLIRACVAVGVEGPDGAGIISPAQLSNGEWTIEDCLAHNNRHAGFKAYINTSKTDNKVVTRLTAYRNDFGIDHGAYQNSWLYDTFTLYDNTGAGVRLRAVANSSGILFANGTIDQAGRNSYGVVNARHFAGTVYQTRFSSCTFKGHTKAAVGLTYSAPDFADLVDLVNCSFIGNQLWFANTVQAGCLVRLQDPANGSISARRKDKWGVLVPTWNARKAPIAPFA